MKLHLAVTGVGWSSQNEVEPPPDNEAPQHSGSTKRIFQTQTGRSGRSLRENNSTQELSESGKRGGGGGTYECR